MSTRRNMRTRHCLESLEGRHLTTSLAGGLFMAASAEVAPATSARPTPSSLRIVLTDILVSSYQTSGSS
jgi:hypothetical protein